MKYDVQAFLKSQMPGLIDLLGTQNISWVSINEKFGNNLQKIEAELRLKQKTILKEATFYSILIYKYIGSGETDGMFDWYRTIFESLSLNLTSIEKTLIRAQIYSVLIELSKDYLNFIGELAILNEIKKFGIYDLINIEEQIQTENNKCADFLFLNKVDNTKILVEVVNLHLYQLETGGNKNVKQHIEDKLKKKMQVKFIKPKYTFYLQPVIWTKSEMELELLTELYEESGIPINNVLPPFHYSTYKYISGQYEHRFERIYQYCT